jgi:hypothetical protein
MDDPHLFHKHVELTFREEFFFNSHSGRWSPYWVHSTQRPLNGLLYLPWVIVMMENLVE